MVSAGGAVAGGLLAAVWGLVAGSFLSLCVYRLPRGMSVIRPGSHCPHCGHRLRAWENLPLASFVWLRGRCRECGQAIGWRDPLLEAGCGVLFYWSWAQTRGGLAFVHDAFFLACLLALAATDLAWRQLPDEITLGGWVAGLGLALAVAPGWPSALAASAGAAGGLALMGWGYQRWRGREGLGWGDVKMLGFMGAFLGVQATMAALLMAAVAAALVGMAQTLLVMRMRRRRGRSWAQARASAAVYIARAALPFGAFLAAGAALALHWSPWLWQNWLG